MAAKKAAQAAQLLNGNNEESNERPNSPVASDAQSGTDASPAVAGSSESERVSPAAAPAQPAKPVGLKIGGIKLGGPKPAGGTVPAPSGPAESSSGTTAPASSGIKLGGLRLGNPAGSSNGSQSGNPTPAVGTPTSAGSNVGGLGLLDIASLDTGETKLDFERTIQDAEGDYLDQVPATAPDREIPEGMAEHAIAFMKSLDSIYNLHNDREMFVSVVSKIMSEMQEDKSLAKLLAPEDANAIMRGMRQAAGMAQVKKVKATEKRKGGSSKNSAIQAAAMDSLLSVAGFDLSAL